LLKIKSPRAQWTDRAAIAAAARRSGARSARGLFREGSSSGAERVMVLLRLLGSEQRVMLPKGDVEQV
jgi:hypothetical protein